MGDKVSLVNYTRFATLAVMFTGIIEAMGSLRAATPQDGGMRLIIDRAGWKPLSGQPIRLGDSIAISGVCLTIVEISADTLAFDVITETLAMTTLGELTPGGHVNIEPSLAAGSPMGGHFVQGHIDGIGIIRHIQTGADYRITIEAPDDLVDYIVPKGSITIDGISLTVASVEGNQFDVALIPTTLEVTTLGQATIGGRVNLESDIFSRTIIHHLRARKQNDQGVTADQLREAGFIA